jgi:hypothetical protein
MNRAAGDLTWRTGDGSGSGGSDPGVFSIPVVTETAAATITVNKCGGGPDKVERNLHVLCTHVKRWVERASIVLSLCPRFLRHPPAYQHLLDLHRPLCPPTAPEY